MNRFSSFNISNQIFYQSKLSLGLVNLKPLVPGHVLVISKRIVSRLNDLTENEISDLFLSVQQISKLIQSEYNSQ
jgi:bis(5'-adenosyl)-triphosphatase